MLLRSLRYSSSTIFAFLIALLTNNNIASSNPWDGKCSGWFNTSIANIYFAREKGSEGSRLHWRFLINRDTESAFGPVVTVYMQQASIEVAREFRLINPPYAPHTEPIFYDFHGSFFDTILLENMRG